MTISEKYAIYDRVISADIKEITEAILSGRYVGETTGGTTWNLTVNWPINDEEWEEKYNDYR